MIAVKFTIERDIGLTFLLQAATSAASPCPLGGLWAFGHCCRSGGAEVPGELLAQFLVVGPETSDLVAIGAQPLVQRVNGGTLDGR